MKDDSEVIETRAGNGFVLYASSTHLYVASTTWGEREEGGGGGGGKGVAVGEGGVAGGSSFRLAEPMTVIIKVELSLSSARVIFAPAQFAMNAGDPTFERLITAGGDVEEHPSG